MGTVGSKSCQKSKLKPNDTLKKMPVQVLQEKLTRMPPIIEETEGVVTEEETQPNLVPELPDHSPKPRKETDNISTASSDGKMSALIPNLNVPVNNGTIQITLRWKTSVEVSHLTQSSLQMTVSIYALLNELFSDEDGLIYKWDDEGMENFNSFSKQMSPEEVQSFIFPSITIMPSNSVKGHHSTPVWVHR